MAATMAEPSPATRPTPRDWCSLLLPKTWASPPSTHAEASAAAGRFFSLAVVSGARRGLAFSGRGRAPGAPPPPPPPPGRRSQPKPRLPAELGLEGHRLRGTAHERDGNPPVRLSAAQARLLKRCNGRVAAARLGSLEL